MGKRHFSLLVILAITIFACVPESKKILTEVDINVSIDVCVAELQDFCNSFAVTSRLLTDIQMHQVEAERFDQSDKIFYRQVSNFFIAMTV